MKEYLSCAETAKLIRACLKESFPGVKFSVNSKTYSGGASIRIGWTDGPNAAQVKAVTGVFEGSYFDGMIDYKGSYYHTLDGNPVSMGADFIFCNRAFSDPVVNRTIQRIQAKWGFKGDYNADQWHRGEFHTVYIAENARGERHWSLNSELWRELTKLTFLVDVKKSKTLARVKCTGNDGYSKACGADIA